MANGTRTPISTWSQVTWASWHKMGNCIKNCIFNTFKMLFHKVSSVLESSATCCCPPSSRFRNFTLWYRIVKIWEVALWAPPSELCGHTPASHKPLHWPFPRAALTLCGFPHFFLNRPLEMYCYHSHLMGTWTCHESSWGCRLVPKGENPT